MFNVILCLAVEHDLKLVVLAAIVCALGSFVTFRLFERGLKDKGLINLGWQFLAATAAGTSVWSTHFIAILAYRSGAPVSFDPVATIASLLVAICGTFAGFAVAGTKMPFALPAGGMLVGLAATAMHYMGMNAYHIDGLVSWSRGYVAASVVIAIAASAAALAVSRQSPIRAAAIFVAGIVGLHFTGMTAMTVTPLVLRGTDIPQASFTAMALAIALACFVIAGTGLISFIIDDRIRSASNRKLHHLALYDGLTGLPNRQNMMDRLLQEFVSASRDGRSFAYVGMDLDRFKEINDVRGHAAGDRVLSVIGERLKGLTGEKFFFARIGGDEFAAICQLDDERLLAESMIHIKTALVKPVVLDDRDEVTVGVSLGAAFYPTDAADPQELVNKADLAMYRAKSHPTSSICFYDAAMDEAVRSRKALTADLRSAIANRELELYYQVQTSISTGEIVGYEVLLRWNHPERGWVSPVEFIPIAEESGLILDIGRWVLETACEQASRWPNDLKIAVNLSPIQFSDSHLPDLVRETLEGTGLDARRLELELTESTIVENRDRTLAMIDRIKQLGVTIALDDFGTGYSSLETLRSFPFDKIKLDRSFMHEIEESPQARAIIRAVLALGKSLEIPVLAEGVETRHQFDILNAEGCDAAQGYLLGRPAPLADIEAAFATPDTLADGNVGALKAVLAIAAEKGPPEEPKSGEEAEAERVAIHSA